MAHADRLAELLALLRGKSVYRYSGRVLVTPNKLTLLETPEGLPDMLSQLDIDPGQYQAEIRFVRIDSPAPDKGDAINGP